MISMRSSSSQPPALAPRVFLAFDDFSRAGKHVLRLAAKPPTDLPPPLLHSSAFEPHVRCWTSARNDASYVVVDSALIATARHWELADALVQSLVGIETLVIIGAVHLPYAKPADDGAVYHAALGAAAPDGDDALAHAAFLALDADWEIKDSFLSTLLHLLAVERSTAVRLLLAKGYRPGRSLAGTYEERFAVETLAGALKTFTRGELSVDPADLKLRLPALLADDPSRGHDSSSSSPAMDHDALLLYN